METGLEDLAVTSHVGRDLLQSSAVFTHERLVVWEYVSNGLDYVDAGTSPIVKVIINNNGKKITIIDNGRGMTFEDLANFFKMHGENQDRKNKRGVRGFFGTGKSAAFGIAETLTVTTIRNNKTSKVQLNKTDIEAASSGDPVPVKILERDSDTKELNGTVIEIEGVHIKTIDQKSIIEYLEQHLARWSKDAIVFVNNHECEFIEPPIAETYVFETTGKMQEALGDIQLCIKVAKTPLSSDLQGVAIYSDGVWYETTMAGSERKDLAGLIFGEVEVPMLNEQGTADIPAFDLSRRMSLNKMNPVVQSLHAFIGLHIEEVRKKLVERENERRKSEEARKLQTEADKIAEIINHDFDEFSAKLKTAQAKIAGTIDISKRDVVGEGDETALTSGEELSAVVEKLSGPVPDPEGIEEVDRDSDEHKGPHDREPEKKGNFRVDEVEDEKLAKEIGSKKKKRSKSGGFRVDFKDGGVVAARASYESESRTIWINLEHPQIATALSAGGVDDIRFKRLAYEVAFSEYAIGLVQELNNIQYYFDISDAIYAVRETLNRISRAGAQLYADV